MENNIYTGNIKIAFFDLTGCNGCLLSMINEPKFFEVADNFHIKSFRLLKGMDLGGTYDISLVEGHAGNEEELDLLKKIREKSEKVVAIGACACTGSIQSIRNFLNIEEVTKYVYPNISQINIIEAKSIGKHIRVDLEIPGCPPNGEEIVKVLKSFLIGKIPELITHAVCVECKIREKDCILIRGIPCLGPVSRGGCGAPCPSAGYICDGCRGPAVETNMPSEIRILEKILSKKDLVPLFRRYAGTTERFKNMAEGKFE